MFDGGSVFRKTFVVLLLVPALHACTSSHLQSNSEVKAAKPVKELAQAAYAMPDKYAARVVHEILDDGGNAVDAAIAAAFVLAVTFPEAGNIGGGGFMLAHMDGENHFLDYREKAPLTASRDMYLDCLLYTSPSPRDS